MQLSERKWLIGLITVFVVAFGLRIAMTANFVGLDSPPDLAANPDQQDYEQFAHHLSTGQGYTLEDGTPTARRAPGTSLAISPVYALFGRSHMAARIWFCYLSAATCVAVMLIVVQVFGRTHAIVAGALLAVYPGHFYHSMHLVSEVPYGLALSGAVALSLYSIRHKTLRIAALAGLCWGMAILTMPQIILALPIGAFAIAIAWMWMPKSQWRLTAKQVMCQVVLALAVVSPWVVRNAIVMDHPTLANTSGKTLWESHNEVTMLNPSWSGQSIRLDYLEETYSKLPVDEVEADREAWNRGMASIREHRSQLPAVITAKLGRFLSPIKDTPNTMVKLSFAVAWILTIPFIGIGVWQTIKRNRTATFVALIPVAITFATVIIFYGSVRFRDSLAPLFIAATGVGITHVATTVIARWKAKQDQDENGVLATLPQDQSGTTDEEQVERKAA
jgi:4-amino-4-deoxy-L-arabinose transferase-like glycosyltransferase